MKYVANPVTVEAYRIKDTSPRNADHGCTVWLEEAIPLPDGKEEGPMLEMTSAMTARHFPREGDFLVIQAEGHRYIEAAGEFHRKYSPDQATIAETTAKIAGRPGFLSRIFRPGENRG